MSILKKSLKQHVMLALVLVSLPWEHSLLAVGMTSRVLTFEECVAIAKKENLTLRSQSQTLSAQQQGIEMAKSEHWPSLSGSVKADRSGTTPSTMDSGFNATEGASVGLKIPLYSGSATTAKVAKAQANYDGATASFASTAAAVHNTVAVSFYNLLYAQQDLVLVKRIEQRRLEQKQLMDIRYRGGLEAKWAATKANADWLDAKAQIRVAESTLNSRMEALKAALNLSDPTESIQAQGGFYEPHRLKDFDVQALLAHHPDIKQKQMEIFSLQQDVEIQRAAYKPALSVGAGYSYAQDPSKNKTKSWSVGVELTYTFFDQGRSPALYQSVEILEAKRLEAEQQKRDLVASVTSAIFGVESAEESLESAKRQLEAAKEREMVVTKEYIAGLLQYNDWEQAQSQLIQAETAMLKARLNGSLAVATFKLAIGKDAL